MVHDSIVQQRTSGGSYHAEEKLYPNLINPYLTFVFPFSPFGHRNNSLSLSKVMLEETCFRLQKLERGTKSLASGLGKLEYGLSGQGYVKLGMSGSPSSYRRVQTMTHVASSLTQLYFMLDSAKRMVMSAAVHLCLMFFYTCLLPLRGRNGCKIYLGQSYNVSTLVPCLSSLGGSEYPNSIRLLCKVYRNL